MAPRDLPDRSAENATDPRCYVYCHKSRDCEGSRACLENICVFFETSCQHTECPEGFFCNAGYNCEKFPEGVRCDDAIKNGDETAIDCGGTYCAGCAEGEPCLSNGDCLSSVCDENVCVPSCSDGIRDGTESDTDCGGLDCSPCATERHCNGPADCASGVCRDQSCAAPSCDDGVANGTETGVDCGGGCVDFGKACADGVSCVEPRDCQSRVCDGVATQTCLAPTCIDGVKNGNESDMDCGEACAADGQLCGTFQICATPADCQSNKCVNNRCDEPSCSDGLRTGTETDVDCGGPECLPCDPGESCSLHTDCSTGACWDGTCQGLVVALGSAHSCVRLDGGHMRCWGWGFHGQLGHGSTENLGDAPGEMPPAVVSAGGVVMQIALGAYHTCALLSDRTVRCWGTGSYGQTGQVGSVADGTLTIGDEPGEMPPAVVNVGESVKQIAAGSEHTCALLSRGAVRCWGKGSLGRLGYGNTDHIGDDPGEMPPADVPVGGVVKQIAVGRQHTCALLVGGTVRCWGAGSFGRLGYGGTDDLGDQVGEMPPADVDLGGVVSQISAGEEHTCALLETGTVRCWGRGAGGALGYGNTDNIGDGGGEMPPGDVSVGGDVAQVVAGGQWFTCALLTTGNVRCWGYGRGGALGSGSTDIIGDEAGEMPPDDVAVGGEVTQIGAGSGYACATLSSGVVRCWGGGEDGRLGYGNELRVGDEPGEMPPADLPIN